MSTAPRGEARRAHLLEATLRVVAEEGPDAVTHRRVAAEAGLPLAATTYWFASKDELLREAYTLVATRDLEQTRAAAERLRGRAAESGADLAAGLAAEVAHELIFERAGVVAGLALCLEAARRPELRDIARGWTDGYVAVAAELLAAAGSSRAQLDARLVVATLDGLLLEQLARDERDFETRTLRPALSRLIEALLAAPG